MSKKYRKKIIFKLFKLILSCFKKRRKRLRIKKSRILFNIQTPDFYFYGVNRMSIKAGNIVIVHIAPVDAYGNAAKIDGVPTWNISNPDIVTAESLDAEGKRVKLTSVGPTGFTTIIVTVDADLSEGIRTLKGELILEIEAGEAVDIGFIVEPPIEVALTPAVEEAPVEAVVEEAAPVVEEAAPVIEEPVIEPAIVEETPVVEPAPVEPAPVEETPFQSATDDSVFQSPSDSI